MNNQSAIPTQQKPAYSISLHKGVEQFLRKLPADERARSFKEIELLEALGPKLDEPHVGSLGKGLWELKFRFNKKWFRYIFVHEKYGHYNIVHGFVKKTNQTPENEKEIARKRIHELAVKASLKSSLMPLPN